MIALLGLIPTGVVWLVRLLGGGSSILSAARAILVKSTDAKLETDKALIGAERDVAVRAIDVHLAANNVKAARESSDAGIGGLIMLVSGLVLFALPVGVWWWCIMLDTTGLHGGAVGSWRIADFPGPLAALAREIIQSFFVTTGVVAGVGAAAGAITRVVRGR